MTREQLEWHYKDANRNFWRITARRVGTENDAGIDWAWRYKVWRELGGRWRVVHDDHYTGQLDEPPTLAELLIDFTRRMTVLAIGFVIHGAEEGQDGD